MSKINIYVIKCKNDKYYVGRTKYLDERVEDHLTGQGSTWTKMNKPIKLLRVIKDCDKYDEDKYVLMYMEKYGVNNVRGGSYSQIKLSEGQMDYIKNQMAGANDKCFKCNKSGHFVKNCPENKKYCCDICGKAFPNYYLADQHEKACFDLPPSSCDSCDSID